MSNLATVVKQAQLLAFPPRNPASLDAVTLARHVPLARHRLRAGQYIHRAGEPLTALFLLHAGTAKTVLGSADGRVYGLNIETGKEVWQYEAGGGFTGSPAVAQGRLIIASDDGVVYCFGEK